MALKPAPISETPKGVKSELGALYVYPDGHGNITFADGTNWPFADELEAIEMLAGLLLRPMLQKARRKWRAA